MDPARSGNNLYVYCGSNPILNKDPSGRRFPTNDAETALYPQALQRQAAMATARQIASMAQHVLLGIIGIPMTGTARAVPPVQTTLSPIPVLSPSPTSSTQRIVQGSSQVIAFIKVWEGYSLTSYDASPGVGDWTIGWGHQLSEYYGNPVNPNVTWTPEQAENQFTADMNAMETTTYNGFLQKNNISLTQNQYDAMLDWTFNFGPYIWDPTKLQDPTAGETMRDFLLAGDYSEAATRAAFAVYMGSKAQAGQITRRNQEINMFLYSDYTSTH